MYEDAENPVKKLLFYDYFTLNLKELVSNYGTGLCFHIFNSERKFQLIAAETLIFQLSEHSKEFLNKFQIHKSQLAMPYGSKPILLF